MIPRLLRSAFVIGRRDFTATVFSKAFVLFLLGPLFPIAMVMIFGAATTGAPTAAERPTVGIIAEADDYAALAAARKRLGEAVGTLGLIELKHEPPRGDAASQRDRLLNSRSPAVVAVLEGGLDRPRLTGSFSEGGNLVGQVQLLVEHARRSGPPGEPIALARIDKAAGSLAPARALTARAGQTLLFLLTILLSGMLLSQLIEEKSNKIIEVLAAAVPMDAIFLGKLFAMLLMSLVGVALWGLAGAAAIAVFSDQGLAALPAPAVGWPAFLLLGFVYFAMSYLLLGAVFLGIGAQASSAREVQTLSMPVTMAQVIVFAFASMSVGEGDSSRALAAAAFPLSSPFVMVARAAEQPDLWPHLLAVGWQMLWIAVIIAIAARVFRRSVLKSGAGRPFWRRRET